MSVVCMRGSGIIRDERDKKYVSVPWIPPLSVVFPPLPTHYLYANDINATSRNNAVSHFLCSDGLLQPNEFIPMGWWDSYPLPHANHGG